MYSQRLDVALDYHLRHNHYPPTPELIPFARRIIDRWEGGDHDLDYVVDGIQRDKKPVTASELAESLHLECFNVGVEEEDMGPVCERCDNPCEYDSEVCLCKSCQEKL